MRPHFIAYIDEAGDEGLDKLSSPEASGQSRWLVLGGLLVRKEYDAQVVAWRDETVAATVPPHIRNKLSGQRKKRSLHFKDLKHYQRVAACEAIKDKRFGIVCVCSNKETLLNNEKEKNFFSQKGNLYNYLTRFLLERLTWQLAQFPCEEGEKPRLTICFSRRGGTNYESMKEYFELMRDGREVKRPIRSIDWEIFSPDDIKVENHSKRAGLQLADVVTSATFQGLNPGQYGYCEPRYALTLASRFLHRNRKGNIRNHGLTLIPSFETCPLTEDQKEFILELERRQSQARNKYESNGS
ncbi:DUF3800 domain-containing protein [Oecophyllibacter saccharovorans]|uniref:DUF3800 domain-containing protein n=1 Tax=Oecophyllibacter saccharovorans TaxID=2558360 RepID=A0A506UM42_9PROT|nr:DUF3800 domain-containing protein [Oecophyllibacter saccharovorans]TPW34420.1 DUF3800 domain-containing protein [Oecophyllibacter saccharovorans]